MGSPKSCESVHLPLTAHECVDVIITEMGVFHVRKEGMILYEYFSNFTIDEIKKATDCPFTIHENLKVIPIDV